MNRIHKMVMALCAVVVLASNHYVQAAALPAVAVSNGKRIAVSILRQLGDTSVLISRTKLAIGAAITAVAAGTAAYVANKPAQKPIMVDAAVQTGEDQETVKLKAELQKAQSAADQYKSLSQQQNQLNAAIAGGKVHHDHIQVCPSCNKQINSALSSTDFVPVAVHAAGNIATLKPAAAQTMAAALAQSNGNAAATLTPASAAVLATMPTLDSLQPATGPTTQPNSGGTVDDKHNG